jgi:hypothetical protein
MQDEVQIACDVRTALALAKIPDVAIEVVCIHIGQPIRFAAVPVIVGADTIAVHRWPRWTWLLCMGVGISQHKHASQNEAAGENEAVACVHTSQKYQFRSAAAT